MPYQRRYSRLMATQELTQLNVRVPDGMVRVLDALADDAHMSRAHYLALLVKQAQVSSDLVHDAEVLSRHGRTKLNRNIGDHGMQMLEEGRAAAGRHQ